MAVVDIHTGIILSPKHAPLSDGAFRLWLHALCWSKEHLTDGFIPTSTLIVLHQKASRFVPELLEIHVAGKGPLWHETDGGYLIHDYEQWQETKGRVQERREMWRNRKNQQRSHANVLPSVTRDTHESPTQESRGSHAGVTRTLPLDGSGSGISKEKETKNVAPSGALFARFWQSYPRHTGKANAAKSFARIKPDDALVEVMLAALAWQKQTDQWQRGIVPHPATWINGRRWEDERPVNGTHRDETIRQVDWSNV